MIPCHSAALRCTWPFAVTCMTPSSIENEIAHLTVAAFSSHLSRLRREERLVMTAYEQGIARPLDRRPGRRDAQDARGAWGGPGGRGGWGHGASCCPPPRSTGGWAGGRGTTAGG